jgi:hypothetical protein
MSAPQSHPQPQKKWVVWVRVFDDPEDPHCRLWEELNTARTPDARDEADALARDLVAAAAAAGIDCEALVLPADEEPTVTVRLRYTEPESELRGRVKPERVLTRERSGVPVSRARALIRSAGRLWDDAVVVVG